LVAEDGGVRWIDDSKATNVHATIAAVSGLVDVVLLAGGRNKGPDLRGRRAEPPRGRGDRRRGGGGRRGVRGRDPGRAGAVDAPSGRRGLGARPARRHGAAQPGLRVVRLVLVL